MLVDVARRDPLNECGCIPELAFTDVQQDQHRLLRQEPKAPDRALLVCLERLVADRPTRLQRRLQSGKDLLFALVRLALGGGAMPAARPEAFEPAVVLGEVRGREFEGELREIARGGDRAPRRRTRA